MRSNNTIFYSYNELVQDIENLTARIINSRLLAGYPCTVLGLTQGGTVPALYLAKSFGAKAVFCAPAIDELETTLNSIEDCHTLLIVDEICDTGKTFFLVDKCVDAFIRAKKRAITNVSYCCLINNISQDVFDPCFAAREIDRNIEKRWFDFFWEFPTKPL